MYCLIFISVIYLGLAETKLWPKGVVHFSINTKDYDPHSQDIILSSLDRLEKEVCVKFFKLPFNYTATSPALRPEKIVFVTNPEKLKECKPLQFNLTETIVDIPIGYKCMNERDIANIFADMLKATFRGNSDTEYNYELLKDFETKPPIDEQYLLREADRNLINTYYYTECGNLHQPLSPSPKRRYDDEAPAMPLTFNYYANSTWPLGVVMYTVEPELRGTPYHTLLKQAMTVIELSSCIVFQFTDLDEAVLSPKNVLIFGSRGADEPAYGFVEGQQELKLEDMVNGCRGHTAHTLNVLFRILGIPMTSNRYDRDNYIRINWKNVIKGKEHLLEKVPEEAFVHYIPYEFESVTHAPANFMCAKCDLGANTVEPIQDLLWQRTLVMGHRTVLSNSDVQMLRLVYGRQCARRHTQGENRSPFRQALVGNEDEQAVPASNDDSVVGPLAPKDPARLQTIQWNGPQGPMDVPNPPTPGQMVWAHPQREQNVFAPPANAAVFPPRRRSP